MRAGAFALDRTIATLAARLRRHRTPEGHWRGHLASSALSTATAVIALRLHERAVGADHGRLVRAGIGWLGAHQNPDGGWGDTVISASNLSTTVLCWAALTDESDRTSASGGAEGAEKWLRSHLDEPAPDHLARAVLAAYGTDRTFSAPILSVLALTGKLGADGWRLVPQLPFELAACPHKWLEWLRLPVVSYALPALVAIGQARHHHRPTRMLPLRALRSTLRPRVLAIARRMQPESGGYLEATPLTAFVAMNLIGAGGADHAIVEQGIRFLTASARDDGSWPIDTDLATWVTTLAVDALDLADPASADESRQTRDWLLGQQAKREHPFTHAKPGGWAWTDSSGGVPDADDTAGALLALRALGTGSEIGQATAGVKWLLDLQNRDGGIPTFCRGWGALPFDRSAPDLTAHALRAWHAWYPDMDGKTQRRIAAATMAAISYLRRSQRGDGSWAPLWFGNEKIPDFSNPTYGTSRVLVALALDRVRSLPDVDRLWRRGVDWLAAAQDRDGGWGGGTGSNSSIEETGLALEALAAAGGPSDAMARGIEWLVAATDEGRHTPPAAIGLYFARLWYYEDLYPIIFALKGLAAVRRKLAFDYPLEVSG